MKLSIDKLTNILAASIAAILAQQIFVPQLLSKDKALYAISGLASVGQYLTGKKYIDTDEIFNYFLPKANAAITPDLISEINELRSQITGINELRSQVEEITRLQVSEKEPTPTETSKKYYPRISKYND